MAIYSSLGKYKKIKFPNPWIMLCILSYVLTIIVGASRFQFGGYSGVLQEL